MFLGFSERSSVQMFRLKMESDVNVNDPSVMETILQQVGSQNHNHHNNKKSFISCGCNYFCNYKIEGLNQVKIYLSYRIIHVTMFCSFNKEINHIEISPKYNVILFCCFINKSLKSTDFGAKFKVENLYL